MSGPLDIFKDVVRRLEGAQIEYFLVGSLASMHYGRPRFTNDVDLVVQVGAGRVSEFEKLFNIEEYYCPPHEVVADEIIRGGSFNLVHHQSGTKVDIIILKKTAFYDSEFRRRKKVRFLPDFEAYIASPEDIIVKKLDFYREGESEKHLTDIRSILAETKVDREYINQWISKLGLTDYWAKI